MDLLEIVKGMLIRLVALVDVSLVVVLFIAVEFAAMGMLLILFVMSFYSVSLCYFWLLGLWCICFGFFLLVEFSSPLRSVLLGGLSSPLEGSPSPIRCIHLFLIYCQEYRLLSKNHDKKYN